MQSTARRTRRALLRLWRVSEDDARAFFRTDARNQQLQDSKGYTHFRKPRSPSKHGKLAVAGCAGLATAAYISSLQEIPYSHRRHSTWITVTMEQAMGKTEFQSIQQQAARSRTLLPPYHPEVKRVERIGRHIAYAALQGKGGGFYQHLENLEWEFIVVQRNDPNAMVLPGGKVVVHTGLLNLLPTDEEVAAVLGHEVAHVVARHAAEKLSKAQIFELLRAVVFWTIGIPIPSGAVHLAIFLPNSRKLETEADVIAAVSVLQKLGEAERRSSTAAIPGFLRTHPLSDKRVERVREELPAARLTYELSQCGPKKSALANFVESHGIAPNAFDF